MKEKGVAQRLLELEKVEVLLVARLKKLKKEFRETEKIVSILKRSDAKGVTTVTEAEKRLLQKHKVDFTAKRVK